MLEIFGFKTLKKEKVKCLRTEHACATAVFDAKIHLSAKN